MFIPPFTGLFDFQQNSRLPWFPRKLLRVLLEQRYQQMERQREEGNSRLFPPLCVPQDCVCELQPRYWALVVHFALFSFTPWHVSNFLLLHILP